MKQIRIKMKKVAYFIPVACACIGMVYLGTMFLEGYKVGNALPHTGGTTRAVDAPHTDPKIESLEIADTTHVPTTMPDLPTPTKQSVSRTMQHKEQPRVQPMRPQGLPAVAEAATSGSVHVSDAVRQVNGTSTNPTPEVPIPTIPVPDSPQLVE